MRFAQPLIRQAVGDETKILRRCGIPAVRERWQMFVPSLAFTQRHGSSLGRTRAQPQQNSRQ